MAAALVWTPAALVSISLRLSLIFAVLASTSARKAVRSAVPLPRPALIAAISAVLALIAARVAPPSQARLPLASVVTSPVAPLWAARLSVEGRPAIV